MSHGGADRPLDTHERRRIGVVLFGFGTVGQATLELCLQRPSLEVCGIIARSAAKTGRAAAEFVQGAPPALGISDDAVATLQATQPDVVLHATQSRVRDIAPHIRLCLAAGASVISSSEELAFVELQHPAVAAELTALAQQHGRVIAATGVNPGFVFDVLPLTLAGAAWDVSRITVRRVLDASVFGQVVHRRLGLGFTEEEFHSNVQAGEIWGHIGFPESAAMLCRSMGRTLDHVEQVLTPLPAGKDYQLRDWRISAGTSAGVVHRAVGWVGQEPWLEFEVVLHVSPADMGWPVKDEIVIDGRHRLSVTIEPSCNAVLTTAARLVNSIPRVLQARPGLYAPVDLPPSGPWFAPEVPGS